MAHGLFAYGFLGKAVKKGLALGKSGESLNCVQGATAEFSPFPSYLGWGQDSSCQRWALTFPPNACSWKNVISGTRVKFLIFSFWSQPQTLFFSYFIKFGLVWNTTDKRNAKGIPHEP